MTNALRRSTKDDAMAVKTPRTELLGIRAKPETIAAAKVVAALTGRTVSSLAEYALELYIRHNYPLAYDPKAVLKLSLTEAPTEGATP